jgi:hypothetical protein
MRVWVRKESTVARLTSRDENRWAGVTVALIYVLESVQPS